MLLEQIARQVVEGEGFLKLAKEKKKFTVELSSLVGSAYAIVGAEKVKQSGGIHIFVADDRDAASYLCNDFYQLVDASRVYFFPTAYKRSIQFGAEDPSGIIQRTTALNAIRNHEQGYLVVCTYPEALVEKVIDRQELRDNILTVAQGEHFLQDDLIENLVALQFTRVDFVHEPGQFSQRGGIVDIFPFSTNKPYRIDFFGDEIDSIRVFDVSSQLSVEKLDRVEIVPNMKSDGMAGHRVSLAAYAGTASWWIDNFDYLLRRLNDIRAKILKELDEPRQIDNKVISRKSFLADTQTARLYLRKDNATERVAEARVDFKSVPQPAFNKNFELLADDLKNRKSEGYRVAILSDNRLQFERLENIFSSQGERGELFEAVDATLSGGFIDHRSKLCVYTDHQIFDRHMRYRLNMELERNEGLAIAELNTLEIGDYVTHIDHGVGRFGGLVRTVENGKTQEVIKLVYRDNDVLFVNVHALHRIAKYKDKESEPPRVYKLGSGAWQRLKQATKRAVKDIARELIALYSKRKSSDGFAFSADTYLQHELEASFIYEDTPDQRKTTEDVKGDMESRVPMDRLVCGDVGFGKTEIAIRAAFKAVTDSKQVAVLVPTTILALQHFRSFAHRLKEFPVRVDHLSRARTSKEVKEILANLKAGKIDILIGTHKILGKDVEFKQLGLLIIDEEQKFGVAAKEKLRHLKIDVDTLTLSATPIPRTMQFSLMGARDLSIINTPPPNRQPVSTESHLFSEDLIKEAIDFELERGGQVYFVHNRVHDIDAMAGMISRLCPDAKVAVGHGQMNPQQLERVIMSFIYGEYDVLVATSIVENGIDIPNANTIIINNAQNFGLSDLHQLRGRVGRSNRKAFCYLLSPPDEMLKSDSRRRLRAIEEFSDLGSGFNIAMQDLDIRGAGNLLGGEQSGFIADLGFETYMKILKEAMDEMQAEEGVEIGMKESDDSSKAGKTQDEIAGTGIRKKEPPKSYISDSHVEIDAEALLPDGYVEQSAEKMRLYKELDSIASEEELLRFEEHLVDRFGALPAQTRELLNVVRLRHYAVKLGFESVKVKNGLVICRFVSNQKSLYYKTPLFMAILRHVTADTARYSFRQTPQGMGVTIRGVDSVSRAAEELRKLWERALETME